MKNGTRAFAIGAVLIGAPIGILIALLRLGADRFGGTAVGGVAAGAVAAPAGPAGPSLLILLAQIAVIIALSRIVAALIMRLRQPRVVGEIAAGLLLGPSLLGAVAPGVYATLFPASGMGVLAMVANIGVVLFMFLVGLEFDPKLLKGQGSTVVVTSHASIVVPFLCGIGLAFALYEPLAPVGVSFTSFALFMGAAMSVTAFPVLARMLGERGLTQTRMGVVSLGCAAVSNAGAWLILAAVVVLVRASASGLPLWLTLTGIVVLAAVSFLVLKPMLAKTYARTGPRSWLTGDGVAVVLLLVLAMSFATEGLGLHALFGGFVAGVIMPKDDALVRELLRRMQDLTVIFLLPVYFAFTGVRTSFGALGDPQAWVFVLLILGVAVAGKVVGPGLAARLSGMSWRDAGAIGVLMNTRALMELIIINVALDLGVITPELFSMMVVMALVTTAMTTPLLDWLIPAPTTEPVAEPALPEPVPAPATS